MDSMSDYHLVKRRFVKGVWEGIVTTQASGASDPKIDVTLQGVSVPGVELIAAQRAGQWDLRVPVPAEVLGDGASVFLITDIAAGVLLESFTILAGEVLADDVRAEMQLLRDELDMLKRAFRRHCVEGG